MMPFNGVDYL